jgi:hypothetical protein
VSYLDRKIAEAQRNPEWRAGALGPVIARDDDSVLFAVHDLLNSDDPDLIAKARATINRLIDAEIESDVRDADNKAYLYRRDQMADVDGDFWTSRNAA